MFALELRQEVAERVEVIAEPLRQFTANRPCFCNDGIFGFGHTVISSSGVQTIGGS